MRAPDIACQCGCTQPARGKPPNEAHHSPLSTAGLPPAQFLVRSGLAHLEPLLLQAGVTSVADIAGRFDDSALTAAGVTKPIERRKLLALAARAA